MVSLFGWGSSSNSDSTVSRSPSPPALNVAEASNPNINPLNPKGLKPCCACPETKSARDDCFLKTNPDEADIACKDLLEAHKVCMRGYGFKV